MFTLKESVTGAVQILVDTLMCEKPEGETTGFPEFDNLTRGMHRGCLTVLVSPPAQGKTAFALNIANHLIGKDPAVPVLYCSTHGHTELAFRLLTIASGADCSYDTDHGGEGLKRLTEVVTKVADRPLFFMDSRATDEAFYGELAERQAEKHFGLVIVDPARAEHLPRLKKLAQDLDVPILALVSIEKRDTHIPELDLADAAISLSRDRMKAKFDDGTVPVTFVVVGNRFGMRGTCRMSFAPETMRFAEDRDESEPGSWGEKISFWQKILDRITGSRKKARDQTVLRN